MARAFKNKPLTQAFSMLMAVITGISNIKMKTPKYIPRHEVRSPNTMSQKKRRIRARQRNSC